MASGYDFAEQLLTSQRKFANEVVKATAPLLPGNGEDAEGRRQVRRGHARARAAPASASASQAGSHTQSTRQFRNTGAAAYLLCVQFERA